MDKGNHRRKNLAHHSYDYEIEIVNGISALHIIERATYQFPSRNFLVTETRLQSLPTQARPNPLLVLVQ
jgi:hypothetical protein